MKQETKDATVGMVTSRECPLCGHHEIGFVTQDGEFHSLRPGTLIRLSEAPLSGETFRGGLEAPPRTEMEQTRYRIWTPEPLRGDRALRLKYSVMVKEHLLLKGKMSGGLYELAYMEKLERLIEKVLDIPLPVILDRFFASPHLSSGNSRQSAEAMYRELDEIKRPVQLMQDWLDRGDDRSLVELIAPKSVKDLGHESAEDAQVEKELEGLALEEFLEML